MRYLIAAALIALAVAMWNEAGHAGIATVEHQTDPQGQRGWRFWYGGTVHVIDGTYHQALVALKRMHAEAMLLESAVEAIGQYVAEQSAKLFGEEA